MNAAELKVISAGAVRGVVGGMIDDYSKQTGIKFNFTTGPTGLLRDTIASGAPADLIIASAPLMAELEKTGKIMPGSRVDLGRLGLGVVIRDGAAGARRLDAGGAEADADQGAIDRPHRPEARRHLGDPPDEDRGRLRHHATTCARRASTPPAATTRWPRSPRAKPRSPIVLVSEIHDKGAKLAALLPEPLQLWTVYSAAIPASSTDPKNARAFVDALTGPALRQRWIEAGWEPLAK